jgi:FlgD Ig-like domain
MPSRHTSRYPRPDRGIVSPKRTGALLYKWFAGIAAFAILATTIAVLADRRHEGRLASDNTATPLFGASASSPAALAKETSEFGHMPIVRVYFRELPDSNAWTAAVPGLNKSAVVVSFNAPPASILSGSANGILSHFFSTAPTGHPIYYSYYPEPEQYIADRQFTAAAYRAAWVHIASLAKSAHNPYLHSTLVLTNWDLSPQSGRNWKDYLPGGGVISTLGWDAYPAGTVHNRNPQPTPPADFMGPEVAASKSVGLPFGFAEFALGTPVGRPGWLATVADYLTRSGALFGTLFDSPGFPWMELKDTPSIAAWRGIVAKSGLNVPAGSPPTLAPRPAILAVAKLAVSPAAFAPGGSNHVRITFTLSQRAYVTICVLDGHGAVVRYFALPNHAAGRSTIWWYGYGRHGHLLPAGRYPILVVASNLHGSATAETVATLIAP